MKWIVAMSLSCADVRRACVGKLLNLGVSRVVLNVHDTDALHTCGFLNDPRIHTTHFSGMKPRFWFHALDNVKDFDIVWLIDSDVCPYTPQFSLDAVERWFEHGKVGVMQPSILRTSAASRGSDKKDLNMAVFNEQCAATCAIVEQMTPIFVSRLWTQFHRKVLTSIPEAILRTSDWGLNAAWSGLAHKNNLSSLVMLDMFATHYDTRTYDRMLNSTRLNRGVGRASYNHLYKTVPELMVAAGCKHERRCYPRPQ